jgi:hypothetical protein
MSPPEVWGPPIWTFLHALAEKVNEEHFHKIKSSLFFIIKRICNFLPCPECSLHATHFLGRININAIQNKNQFKQMLFVFHNTVNKRRKRPAFKIENINKYKNVNVGVAFNNFIKVYHTKGNMNLLAESFQRSLLISDLKKWLVNNHKFFCSPKIKPSHINNPTNNTEVTETTNNNDTTTDTKM